MAEIFVVFATYTKEGIGVKYVQVSQEMRTEADAECFLMFYKKITEYIFNAPDSLIILRCKK